ncbi:alpha/beta fold hydrolase [Roseateles sp.]|uniref:alpha/beta fold hydrolase n=1 Tax=Roseateles sp. TaxID=1971397 RepID=UPI0039EB3998
MSPSPQDKSAKDKQAEAMQRVIDAPNQFIAVGGGRKLAYRSIGEGKPIVLCVRFRGNMDVWDPAFLGALVVEGFQVVTFDYTGLGLSEGGTPSYSPASLADDANDLIQALQLKDAVISGWSLGGMAAQVFIAKYGTTVSHGVLLGTTPPGPNVKGAEQIFYDTALKPENDLEDEIILFYEPTSAASRTAAKRSHERLKLRTAGLSRQIPLDFAAPALGNKPRSPLFPADPVLEALKRTKLPILHIGADHDIIFPVENWYALNQSLPTLHLHTFPQAGHGPHHQYPVEAARTIAAFVFGTDAA